MKNQDIFYHYCSIDVLLSILKNDELRLSDIEKSNDYTERKWMINKIKDEFIQIASHKFERGKDKLINAFSQLEKEFEILGNVYACCFSTEGDLLSQWRAYAQNGYGVAIGFSGELLEKVNNCEYGIRFLPVIYDTSKQTECGCFHAKRIYDLLLDGDFLFHAMSEVFTNELANLCYYKNPTFSEEKEWRLCIALSPECRVTAKANYDPFIMSEIKLYSNQKKIITYLDLNYGKVKKEIIKEIIFGPKCEISIKDMEQILYILGYPSNIVIKQSKSSYI